MSGVVVATMTRSMSSAVSLRALERPAARDQREIARVLVIRRDVALADAGARVDPFVGGVDERFRDRDW